MSRAERFFRVFCHIANCRRHKAVAEKMSAQKTEKYLSKRASRASQKKFEAVLAKVPDVEPEESDRIPGHTRKARRKRGD